MQEKCPFHDEALAVIHSAVTVVEGKVDKLLELINGTGDAKGLKVEVDRNTRFREKMESDKTIWKQVIPSVVTGLIVGLFLLVMDAVCIP
jgi:hypothetical protein